MPYFAIETNVEITATDSTELQKSVSSMVAEMLGKPEGFVMVALRPGADLIFGGSEGPAAFVRLKSIGLPRDRCPDYSEKICAFLQDRLAIPPDRVFIDFKMVERDLFGWNGKTF